MGKIFYINLITFVCLTINSCADFVRSSESANSYLSEQIWPSSYDILIGITQSSSDKFFAPEQISTEKGRDTIPEKNNLFIVKHNYSGKREWIMDLGLSDPESGISMTFDSSDNVYITGYKRNDLKGNNTSGDFTVLLFKYNSYGSREWIKNLGKSEVEYGARLIVDSSDKIYVTGFTNEFGSEHNLLAKFDPSGKREWLKSLGSIFPEYAWDITIDSKDNLYLTGFLENSFSQHNSWQEDILQIKFNKDGIKF